MKSTDMGDESSRSLSGKVAGSVGWVILERWGSRVLQLLVMTVLTRLVAPSDFGVIALATSVVAVLQVLVDAGFPKALVQSKTLEERDASTAFWTSLALAFGLYTVLFFSAPQLAVWLGHDELTLVLRVLGAVLPISAFSQTPAALLERDFGFKILSIRQVVAAVAGAIFSLPVALLGGGVWALVVQSLGTALVACITLWASSNWRPKFTYSIASLRKLSPLGLSIMGTELLDATQSNIDKIVIGIFFDPATLGYYYIAQRLGSILSDLVTTVIARMSLTTLSRVQDDLPRFNRIFRQMTFVAGAVAMPIFGFVAVYAYQVIPFAFGSGWEPAIPILWGLAGGWGLSAVMYFDRAALLARGRARSAFWVSAMQNSVGVVLLFALLPLGIAGVVISRWARVFVWPVRLWVLRRAVDLEVGAYMWQLVKVVLAVAPWLVVILLLQMTPWAASDWSLLTFAVPTGLLALVGYSCVIWFIAGAENRAAMIPIIKKVLRRG